ncbi:heme exporter protein CcmD [Alcaligenes faecalis]|uniref:heme exporter protein CcmD n=1 Tax=Alcaligenes faecalis TaxID=511 RepID=UPI00211C3AE3|nr:heme exporter protein CcmD [Alcaligenes faecalis]UUO11714.1 heme exporter protein CcmD [Alcaligenes faecalis]
MMHWSSVGDFFAMGGYAVYVWGSVLACTVLMLGEVLSVRAGRARAWQRVRDERALGDQRYD